MPAPGIRRLEGFLRNDALSGIAPHVGYVKVGLAVAVVVEPRCAHAIPHILDARLGGNVAKLAAFVLVQILSPEVIRDEQIGPAIAIIVTPRGREAEAIVILVQPYRLSNIEKPAAPIGRELVVKEEIGRPVPCIVIGNRIAVVTSIAEE